MFIYLAGGISGNLRDFFMKIHLAQASTDTRLTELFDNWLKQSNGGGQEKVYLAGEHPVKNGNDMKVYLAGDNGRKKKCEQNLYNSSIKLGDLNILETFYYLRNNKDMTRMIPYFNSFLLDSGAFTFMQGNHDGEINWDRYIEEYGEFVKKYDIKLFFELDIDSLVGISEVERLRDKLQDITGKPPIPVWHKNRGKDYFVQMCQKYPYVAIGGIITKEIDRKKYEKAFPWFINTAHKYGAKIHGLGYTSVKKLKMYHFDSVDSTSWLYGNKVGKIEKFNPSTGLMDAFTKKEYRIKSKEAAINNFIEWAKFSKYAELYY